MGEALTRNLDSIGVKVEGGIKFDVDRIKQVGKGWLDELFRYTCTHHVTHHVTQ